MVCQGRRRLGSSPLGDIDTPEARVSLCIDVMLVSGDVPVLPHRQVEPKTKPNFMVIRLTRIDPFPVK